jgi:hypothetical protein
VRPAPGVLAASGAHAGWRVTEILFRRGNQGGLETGARTGELMTGLVLVRLGRLR